MKIKYLRPVNDLHLDADIYAKQILWTPPIDAIMITGARQ